jgi:hypothetical protein
MLRGRLEIAPRPELVEPALHFVEQAAAALGMGADDRGPLVAACRVALSMVVARNASGDETVSLVVEIVNRGVPILPAGDAGGDVERFHQAARLVDEVAIQNLGREGQKLRLEKSLGQAKSQGLLAARPPEAIELDPAEVLFRELEEGEEGRLSELFYHVYGYSYINELVYYPEKIRKMRRSGKLISIVAADRTGRFHAHVGLVRWARNPDVYEAALGLVDPRVKSRGLFSRIFEKTMERVHRTPMQYCFFDFVTNHDRSQRVIARHGTRDMAIFVGCQSGETQARLEKLGMGEDPEDMDRYSLLYSIIPCVTHPFGREVSLPLSIGERFAFLLEPFGLAWTPESRFSALPAHGAFRTSYQPQQNAVVFDLHDPGREAADGIAATWQQLLRNGYQYAAVDVPLRAPGLGNLYDKLAGSGFFAAGFIPYRNSAELAFRFQALGPTKVAWDSIRLSTDPARRLLQLIREDHERHARI